MGPIFGKPTKNKNTETEMATLTTNNKTNKQTWDPTNPQLYHNTHHTKSKKNKTKKTGIKKKNPQQILTKTSLHQHLLQNRLKLPNSKQNPILNKNAQIPMYSSP